MVITEHKGVQRADECIVIAGDFNSHVNEKEDRNSYSRGKWFGARNNLIAGFTDPSTCEYTVYQTIDLHFVVVRCNLIYMMGLFEETPLVNKTLTG